MWISLDKIIMQALKLVLMIETILVCLVSTPQLISQLDLSLTTLLLLLRHLAQTTYYLELLVAPFCLILTENLMNKIE